ncbi:MAG: hypothetical protein H8E73_04330, partial [Planctomycetes bacterium]|nr:hypothetical protein [Planctomycetota bacterium]
LSRLKRRQPWPDVLLPAGRNGISLLSRLQLPNGNISPMSALELADVAEPKGALLRINIEQGLELHGKEAIKLPDDLEAFTKNPVIVACPGSATCPRGLGDCWATAEKIREALGGSSQSDMRINISGCPNNCAHSAVADIGLVGMLRKENGEPVQCYRLLRGGGNGRTDQLAEQSHIVRAEDVPATVKRLLE